jgi:hypothetical protein
MSRRSIFFLLIVLIASLEFFVSNEYLKGYLRSDEYLAKEIKTPLDSVYEYKIADEAPFRYRLLFSTIVTGTHDLLYDDKDAQGFYVSYKFWSIFFYVLSACAFFWLLIQCGFTDTLSFAGTMIYLLLPPMVMAYTLPVHTREDTAAYTLFFVGLGLLIKEGRWAFFVVSLLGVVTRETLLLLPLTYFFFGRDERLARKMAITFLPLVLWILVRLFSGGDKYDMWEGLRWNLDNPGQVIGFSFITFNFLWLSFLVHFSFFKRNTHFISADLRFFYRSSIFVFVVIFTTTFLGGIFNEVRLLHLFSPWMVIFFLDCIRNYSVPIMNTFGTKYYWLYAAGAFIFCGILLYFTLRNREDIIEPGKYAVPYDQWIIFSVCYIFVLLLFIPHLFTIVSQKRSVK